MTYLLVVDSVRMKAVLIHVDPGKVDLVRRLNGRNLQGEQDADLDQLYLLLGGDWGLNPRQELGTVVNVLRRHNEPAAIQGEVVIFWYD
jgi:hypothetical protein